MQIVRDVFMVCGFPYGVFVGIHAVKTRGGVVLFDCGTNVSEAKLAEKNLEYWGLGGLPITHVFITHEHVDHSGNAKYFRDKGAKIVVGEGDAEAVETGNINVIDYALAEHYVPCKVDIRVKDGSVVDAGGLKVDCIHVPGHTPGSILYKIVLEGKVILFTGDSIRVGATGKSAILGWTGGPDYDRETYIKSLQKIARYHCDIILGGHYQPMVGDAWKILGWAYRAACEILRPMPHLA